VGLVAAGAEVGATIGCEVGAIAGAEVGATIGCEVGAEVGAAIGCDIGAEVGAAIGCDIGAEVGAAIGCDIGAEVGAAIGCDIGAEVGEGLRAVSCGRITAERYEIGLSKTVAIGCAAGCGRVGRSIGSNEVTAKAGATKPVAMSNAVRNE